jgi:hypothetical protein
MLLLLNQTLPVAKSKYIKTSTSRASQPGLLSLRVIVFSDILGKFARKIVRFWLSYEMGAKQQDNL